MEAKITKPLEMHQREMVAKVLARQSTEKAVVQISGVESECIEIRFFEDPPEVVVLRHGMGYPEGGLAVYSELLDPDILT